MKLQSFVESCEKLYESKRDINEKINKQTNGQINKEIREREYICTIPESIL